VSIRHINAALYLELKDPACKQVLVGLANHADPVTSQCFPSIELLMRYSGASERTVRDALRRAEKLGYVKTTPCPGTSNRYTLLLPDPEHAPRRKSPDPRRNLPPPPAKSAPEPSMNRQEPTSTRARATDEHGWVAEDWTPSAELLAWAETKYPQADIEAQVEPFIRKNRANETVMRNVDEAFKGWLGRMGSLRHPVPQRATKTKSEAVDRKWTTEARAEQALRTIALYRKTGRDTEASDIEQQWRGNPDFEALRRSEK
jgi:hypothetical protein